MMSSRLGNGVIMVKDLCNKSSSGFETCQLKLPCCFSIDICCEACWISAFHYFGCAFYWRRNCWKASVMGVGRGCRRPCHPGFYIFLLSFNQKKVVLLVSSCLNEISSLLPPWKNPLLMFPSWKIYSDAHGSSVETKTSGNKKDI